MQDREDITEVQNEGRRRFLTLGSRFGMTTALVAAAGGSLISTEAAAQTAQEEAERKKAAKHTMTFATAYIPGVSRQFPIMQLDFKENIQNMSGGQIYVNLAHGGKLGAGAVLANKVQKGVIQAAQHSISNFAPFAPAADLINIPYWCATNQAFINLVTSDAWKANVHPAVEENGFKALWYTSTSARTFSVRKGLDPILRLDDLAGIKFRVPGSKMLQQFYRLLGANPTPVAWGETPAAIKQGVADALDPVIGGLVNFGFQDILGHITQAQSVHGGQVFSCNLEWFKSLSPELQNAVEEASDITQRQNLAKVPAAFAYAKAVMEDAGVQVHSLDEAELEKFKEAAGYQRPEWDSFKMELAGSLAKFDELLEASTQINPRYFVESV